MIPVFQEAKINLKFAAQVELSASIMSNLVSLHELGHLALDKDGRLWDELCEIEGTYFQDFSKYIHSEFTDLDLIEEFKCDIIGIINVISSNKENEEISLIINMIVFGYYSFVALFSLADSAKYTTAKVENELESVDFRNLKSNYVEFDFEIVENKEIMVRAKIVQKFLKAFAVSKQYKIYEECPSFPISSSLYQGMINLSKTILNKNILVSDNEDALANLVSESFYLHKKGFDYLYLRSKTFQTNRIEGLKL